MLDTRLFSFFIMLFLLFPATASSAEELERWPREVVVSSGSVTIYQPQFDSLKNNILKGKAAIAFYGRGQEHPVFGVVWFSSRVSIDRQQRTLQYESLDITDTRFPEENKLALEEFGRAAQQAMKTWNLTASLDELTTALAAMEQEQRQASELKTAPPEIIYRDRPALLVTIDGPAVLKPVDKSDYQAVANSPYPLFFESWSNSWFLNTADDVWYRAKTVDGPWTFDDQTPSVLRLMVAEQRALQPSAEIKGTAATITAGNAPAIVVAHHPAELVVSDGKARFTPVNDDLLAISNSGSQVFMDVKSQNYFLVISGRWYRSPSMQGKWHYVPSDTLPASFAAIPTASKYNDVRSYVAGTDEAREAVMDAQIPQTAVIKRGQVDMDLVYDGPPQFRDIGSTGLRFALNCSETVIQAGNQYYLVKDAVWYIAGSAVGPWQVSDHAPPGIDRVPPASPVYNTKYVYVYDSTPEVVYVGYTPGYVGSYIYGPTIVYGTGWYYRPWITPHYYYPRPATWGFHVSYNSWSGWGFGMSWSSGPFHLGFYSGGGYHGSHWGGRHYWGPRGYRPSYRHVNIHNVNINNVHINRGRIHHHGYRNNLYRTSSQRASIQTSVNLNSRRAQSRVTTTDIRNRTTVQRNKNVYRNNVMVDKKGHVARRQNGQWQNYSQGQWHNRTSSGSTAVSRSRSTSRSHSGYRQPAAIDRQHYSRQRATTRIEHYNRAGRGTYRSGGGRRHR